MIFLDTETCGLVGPIVLIQWAEDDGPVHLFDVWKEPVRRTLKLLETFCDTDIVAFNLSFDWFHVNQLYNTFCGLEDISKPPTIDDVVKAYRRKPRTYCLKPRSALDLFLFARKGPWQTLMARRNVRIKKVPGAVGAKLASVLQNKISFEEIYFRRGRKGYKWDVEPCHPTPSPGFVDVVLRFSATSGLKPLVEEIFKINVQEFPLPKEMYPDEHSYDPYGTEWQYIIGKHIAYWHSNKAARGYAENDVIYLQRLYHHWGEPAFGDDDSELACCVGAARWRGFAINQEKVHKRILKKHGEMGEAPRSPSAALKYIHEVCTPTERIVIQDTSKETLNVLCNREGKPGERANQIKKARAAEKEVDVLDKLSRVGRFCPDFKIIGTKSGRMSGGSDEGIVGGSLNPQGINRSKEFRKCFTFAEQCDVLSGGDFDSFEVIICHAWCRDERLDEELRSGKKMQGILGTELYGLDYDDVINNPKFYNPAKNAMYAMFYGASEFKIGKTANVLESVAKEALFKFLKSHPQYQEARQKVLDAFCSMRQPDGIGTEVEWHEPVSYVASLLGFKRYFTLENKICKEIFNLANDPPKELDVMGRCVRRKKEQSLKGATQSALYACAFQIQAQSMRAASNHVIQSTGAGICKKLQRNIWDIQPHGVQDWFVQPMNMHDEIVCAHKPSLTDTVSMVVRNTIESFREIIPLLKMDWHTNLKDWSEK